MLLTKVKLLEPSNPNKATSIINGKASGILNWNDIKYSHFYDIYKTLLGNFWTPFEINMSDDIKQWNMLSERERDAFLHIIGLLSILDSVQPNFIGIMKEYITDPSVKAIFSIIEQQEVVHNQSYSYVLASIEKLSEQNRAFEIARTTPQVYERNKHVINVYEAFRQQPTVHTFCQALVASLVLEGINFYSGFAFFYNLARNQKMLKTSTMISYINKDELCHSYFISQLVRAVLWENPEVDVHGAFSEWIYEYIDQAIQYEIEWSRFVLREIDGIDVNEMTKYIQYLGNKRLRMLGLEDRYEATENSMPWIRVFSDENINLGKTDFFEARPRSYAKTTDINGFDEL
ncbi:ribonucleoside-diphosphate reductase beta chain [Thermolongibacillus altinsuensis]|uniref:Ribonucleoside-diphosphate reductase subunit beta n=1 Tax=Thermolongibacillus altinsuensis TaxID=575256 RepID=A0A4R1QF20_9BACL|nr:ribonucleotide-diphosphate reductase subunit beta [Thermolongibacillus altinsuensis]TCL46529.1 ribonucleoside-diphosphate reductase beta chain [Thermolongibacillus altinsuensis]GMB09889.1 ribonucleoside-diphosphate reductase subunit beta [Thermolongibacillus altinsuensis]